MTKLITDIIYEDSYRYTGVKCRKALVKLFLTSYQFRFIYFFRKANHHKEKKNRIKLLFFKYFHKRYSIKLGYDIPIGSNIGEGLFLNHLCGIAINPKSTIGKNCNITHGVTIGQTNRGEYKGVPTIGDEVWIGANSTIVGNVTIGNNVLIAPNTYVNSNIPSNSIAIGSPAKIISKKNATEDYINKTI